MTNEQIKQLLLGLEETDTDFSVTMTGKSSRQVNGLYKPDSHEILLHNKNFTNENALVYTAIHEYTHHLLCVADGKCAHSRAKAHNTMFWAKMDDLLEKAVSQGVYSRQRSENLTGLIEEAKQIDQEIANLRRKLGKLLTEIQKTSRDEGVRFEDVLSHDIKMQKSTAEKCFGASLIEQDGIGQDMQDALSKTAGKNPLVRESAQKAVEDGKTVEQVKREIQGFSDRHKGEGAKEKLEKEKTRLEKTISALQERLSYVCETIESM